MKCIILCGGYAKRLWPLTKTIPKPLLDINGKLMIDIILDKFSNVDEIKEIIISTNARFEKNFMDWLEKNNKTGKKLKIVIEPTHEEDFKFGTIAGIQHVIKSEKICEDCIIVAGDNLFDYSINDFIKYYKTKNTAILAVFDVKDRIKAQLYGIVALNENNKVIDFIEKPSNPPSTLAATCCYLFPKDIMKLIGVYIDEGNRKDSPGYFIDWLRKRTSVHAFVFKGHWFDIGDLESLENAREFIKKN